MINIYKGSEGRLTSLDRPARTRLTCSLVLTTSMGYVSIQEATPAMPPAMSTAGAEGSPSVSTYIRERYSYVRKYVPKAGTCT